MINVLFERKGIYESRTEMEMQLVHKLQNILSLVRNEEILIKLLREEQQKQPQRKLEMESFLLSTLDNIGI
jgi:hypothetical protein